MAAEAKVAMDSLAPRVSRRRRSTKGRRTGRMNLVPNSDAGIYNITRTEGRNKPPGPAFGRPDDKLRALRRTGAKRKSKGPPDGLLLAFFGEAGAAQSVGERPAALLVTAREWRTRQRGTPAVSAMRLRALSTSRTLTRTMSPGFTTSRGSLTKFFDIAETCTRPS